MAALLVLYSDNGGPMKGMRERYEPDGDTGQTTLSHEGEEGGIVLRGQIELTVSCPELA